MTSAPTTRKVKRFRVKIAGDYASLNFDLHEKGVLVRCRSVSESHVFRRNVDASFAIQRTMQVQSAIQQGMFPQWNKFDPIKYPETPTVEEFHEEQVDPEG